MTKSIPHLPSQQVPSTGAVLLYKGSRDWKGGSAQLSHRAASQTFSAHWKLTVCTKCQPFILHTLQLPSLIPVCWLLSYLVKILLP